MQHADNTQDIVTTVRIPKGHHEALKAIAAKEHRTVSGELRLIVDRHVKRNATVIDTDEVAA